MTRAELLAHILAVSGGEIVEDSLQETIGNTRKYVLRTSSWGEDSDGTPIADVGGVMYYVENEGQPEERAGVQRRRFDNGVDRNPTDGSLDAVADILQNPTLRKRVLGAIVNNIRTDDSVIGPAWIAGRSETILDTFMMYVASNPTIQANGGSATKQDVEYVVVTEAWEKVERHLRKAEPYLTETPE